MDREFWQNAWDIGRIGFHQSEFNTTMLEHYEGKNLNGKSVLIPLAGKSKDILYFINHKAKVSAFEICEDAVCAFFLENEIGFEFTEYPTHKIYKSENLIFYVGDFFEYKEAASMKFDFLYDRAAMVALPKALRKKYFAKIFELVNQSTDILILSLSHKGPLDFGPPFYVPEEEIQKTYTSQGINLSKTIQKTVRARERFQDAGIKEVVQLKWTSA